MTGLFKQQLIAQRKNEADARAKIIMEHLAVGGYNIAQEGIIDTIKKVFLGRGDDEDQMKALAATGKELLGKITALEGILKEKTALKAKAEPIRLPKTVHWFMANDKLIPSEGFAEATKNIMDVMKAIMTSYVPTLDQNVKAVIPKYLTPMFQEKYETDLDLTKGIGWKEPAEMYRLMTVKGPMNQALKIPMIETVRMPGNWVISGIAKPMPLYNVRFMGADIFPLKNVVPAEFKCLTKDQCVEILANMREALHVVEVDYVPGAGLSRVEGDLYKVMKRMETFIPDQKDPNYKAACNLLSLAYTLFRRYDLVYDADKYSTTALRAIYKICEISVNRMD